MATTDTRHGLKWDSEGDVWHDAPQPGEPMVGESITSTPMQSRRGSRVDALSLQDDDDDDDNQTHSPADVEKQASSPPPPPTLTADEDPLQWSKFRKWCVTGIVSSTFLNCTLASSIATGATQQYIDGFGASQEVAALVLSCYMIGFAFGPLLWAPLSEWMGRKAVFLVAIPCFGLINVGCALSNNMATLLVLRVLAGFFGACPQSTAGATISDIWSPIQRPWPMLMYTFCAFGGPVCGPWAGGFLYVSGNWRWIYWLLSIFAGLNTVILAIFQRETYAPVLKRRLKGNDDVTVRSRLHDLFSVHLVRPFRMLFDPRELPLIYAAAWTGWAYALLFIFFEAYPVIFSDIYGFNPGEEGLCFLAFGVGILLSTPIIAIFNRRAAQQFRRQGTLHPEARLSMVTLTAPLYVVGFLWFGWTARSDIHWIVCLLGTIPIGTSVILSFNSLSVYVSQCYHIYSASALGSMAFSRCFLAIFMPLFARQMFEGLGPGWAATILAGVSLLAIPVPIVFMRWGAHIRDRSTLAVKAGK